MKTIKNEQPVIIDYLGTIGPSDLTPEQDQQMAAAWQKLKDISNRAEANRLKMIVKPPVPQPKPTTITCTFIKNRTLT